MEASKRLVLAVEGNADHTRLIEQAFHQSAQHHLIAIADGAQAMRFLRQQAEYAGAARPDLILLDLDLSGKNGREMLSEIKTDPRLRRIPVVVLTLSDQQEDIFRSYELQGNCYVIKSADLDQLAQIVQRIESFWLEIVTLPLE